MNIANKILEKKLVNVCFLWGRGKTTIANALRDRYGAAVYSTDDARERLFRIADPTEQPYLCRDYVKEYKVHSFWELPKEVVADREKHILEELTPFVVAELLPHAAQNRLVICEGDLDYDTVMKFATRAVYLRNCGTKFNWFDRPDHTNLDEIRNNPNLTEEHKAEIIENAKNIVTNREDVLPMWVDRLCVPHIDWDDSTAVCQTVNEVAALFDLK